jgi:hypothetical protein
MIFKEEIAMSDKHQTLYNHGFSTAFERMCSIVAIGKTTGAEETLKELMLHCIVFLPDEAFINTKDFARIIDGLFGLKIPEPDIRFAIEKLVSEGTLIRSATGKFVLPEVVRKSIQDSIDATYSLETKVREGWQAQISNLSPELDLKQVWNALRRYLSNAFQRHGIQTVSLLDSSIDIPQGYSESLSSILDGVLASEIPTDQISIAKQVISDFMATSGNYPERTKYIAELADGAFNYFALAIAPSSANQLRRSLNPLKLFLDTNFLFGVLDLDVNPRVAIASELLGTIQKYGLPFELISHEITIKELLSSINNYADNLGSRKWSHSISRAAVTSKFLSGVELRYYQRFLDDGIDVESFFMPFKHADAILEQNNINVYHPQDERINERATLIEEYKAFLKIRKQEKTYKKIDHDMTVLDIVRQLRSETTSTLEAKALFITCDYTLYKFDWETSKKSGSNACTVLPNIFWQVLRPFIPSDEGFDRSFAQTFAIPEFRIIGSHAAEACSKMLNILAGYKDFPEETAIKMLSNDLLIETLQTIDNDQTFQEYVEAEIVAENKVLLEEKVRMESQLESEKVDKYRAEQELIEERTLRHEHELELQENDAVIHQKTEDVDVEKAARVAAEKRAFDAEADLLEEREKRNLFENVVKAVFVSIISIVAFELIVNMVPWHWLITHPNCLGLQLTFDSLLILFSFGIFIKKWRKYTWWSGVIPFLGILYQLISK